MKEAKENNSLRGKKVIFVLDSFTFGGAERQALYLAEYLKKKMQMKIVFLALNGTEDGFIKRELNRLSIPSHDLNFLFKSTHLSRLPQLIGLAFKVRGFNPEFLLPFTIRPNVNINVFWKFTGAKACFWNQRDVGFGFSFNKKDKIFLRALKETTSYVSNSQEGIDAIKRFAFTHRKPFNKIYNGIKVYEEGDIKKDWRKILSLKSGNRVAIMVSNLTRYKDHMTLLKGWNLLMAQEGQKDNVLILAGRKGETFNDLNGYVIKNNMSESVKFVGQVQNIFETLEMVDVVIHSVKSEGMPNAVLESMAMGRPVIASKIAGNIQCLGKDYSLYFEPGDVDGLSIMMKETMTKKKSEMLEIGRKNKIRVKELFSIDKMGEQYVNIFLKHI